MSKLDELIQELCPEGVVGKFLGEVCIIKTGQPVSKMLISKNPGEYPVINSGRDPLGFIDKYNTDDDPIGITSRGAGVGSVTWCPGKYYRGNLNYSVTIKNDQILMVRFLYYLLMQNQIGIQQLATYQGIPALNKSNLEKLYIFVPPIKVQEKIVNILDAFTKLEAVLSAELKARRIQYGYYRSRLLTFDDSRVQWKTLGEIGKVSMCKRVLKHQTSSVGDIPFYKIGTFGKSPDAFIPKEVYDEYSGKYSYPKKGDILISASGTIGRTVIFDGEPAYFQDSNIIWIDNDEKQVINKYLFYLYEIITWQTEGGTIQRLYNDNLKKIKIAVPPIAEQNRIVSILDRFNKLVNDANEGLPAEIRARRQQYEYYRSKLLTFKELK